MRAHAHWLTSPVPQLIPAGRRRSWSQGRVAPHPHSGWQEREALAEVQRGILRFAHHERPAPGTLLLLLQLLLRRVLLRLLAAVRGAHAQPVRHLRGLGDVPVGAPAEGLQLQGRGAARGQRAALALPRGRAVLGREPQSPRGVGHRGVVGLRLQAVGRQTRAGEVPAGARPVLGGGAGRVRAGGRRRAQRGVLRRRAVGGRQEVPVEARCAVHRRGGEVPVLRLLQADRVTPASRAEVLAQRRSRC
mmetsp:Transcript_104495/g.325854  ORF Transcript_104495/g.325854 Transcript_104495/m.325854 type:complete len:247 (+) Transcript_104495:125-865(+)